MVLGMQVNIIDIGTYFPALNGAFQNLEVKDANII